LGSLGVLVLAGIVVGSAEYYTARPDFCGTCHVMDPYYLSWSRDSHGAKMDVWCVECHYAPGEQHTLKAKFKGLSQVASYFTGRYGASRPRAHVADASCLRSKCHGDGAHLEKELLIGDRRLEKRIVAGVETQVQRSPTVRFVHSKHLNVDSRLADTNESIRKVVEKLKGRTSTAGFARIEQAARSVKRAMHRENDMRLLVEQLGAADLADDALELMRLEHIRLRLSQLEGITCAACHTYDASAKHHFSVDNQSCFVCHFTNQGFNRETGACLLCHEPPMRKIVVHAQPVRPSGSRGPAETAPAGPALMDHMDIVNRGIDCASCHFDVVRGDAEVSDRACTHCHDQDQYLKDFGNRDTLRVADYHKAHVAAQRARCADCHHTVQHQLVDPVHVATSGDFLRPVVDDCHHCHPNHHREQVELLMGVGGRGIPQPMPNAMFGSRLNCRACHGDDYRRLFDQWISEMENLLKEADASLARVEERSKQLAAAGTLLPQDLRAKVDQARLNLSLVRRGNGIHNKNYAMQLLDLSIRELDEVSARLPGP